MDFNFNEKRLNAELYLVMEGFIDIDLDDTYKENKENVMLFFKRFPDAMVSYLTMATYHYLKDAIKDDWDDSKFDHRYFLNEDFRLLVCLGIIDFETLKFNKAYVDVIKKSVGYFLDIEKIIIFQSVLKGLIDVYGFIEMNNLNELMHLYMPEYKEQLLELDLYLTRAGIIFPFIVSTDDYVCRKELTTVLHDFCRVRDTYRDLNYKIYPSADLIKFAGSFTFEGRSNLDLENPFNQLLSDKYLLYYINPKSAVSQLGLKVDKKEDMKVLYQFNIDYPKWLLKGHNILSMREDNLEEEDL